jgi:hypothetical protein
MAPRGHNSGEPLSDDEAAALTVYYQLKIIEAQREVAKIKVDLDCARGVVNGHFKRMAADLGFTRKAFETDVIAKLNMTEAEYLHSEAMRTRMHVLAGLKSGEQIDLFKHVGDTVDDEIDAEANGFRAGRRAADPTPPKETAPILHQSWLAGWHRGQAANGEALTKAAAVLEAREAKKPGMRAEDPPAEEEVTEEVIAKKARKLKKAGWTEPTADETKFPESVN